MTPPWCQGSLLAGPSSGWLPAGAGVCLLAACVRLLCSALLLPGSWGSCAAPGSLWGDPKLWHPPGSGWEQGTVVPVLGSCHGRRQGCSGTGVLCPTEPRPPCLPCQPAQGCCDGGLGTPGSPPGPSGPVSWVMDTWIPPQDAGRSLVAPVSPEPTQLQPCADKSPITAGLGGFSPPFPYFPAGPTGICGPVLPWGALGPRGVSMWSQGLPQEGFPKVGQILGSQEQSAARHPLLFAFSKIKTGRHSVPTPWTLPCQEPGSSWGSQASPAFTLCKTRAVFYLFLSEKGAEFYLQVWGGTSHQ